MPPPFDLLDLGCGPGRDLHTFKTLGHRAVRLEGWNGERYGVFHDWPGRRAVMMAAGLDELDHFHRPPGLPIVQEPWLASVWRKR